VLLEEGEALANVSERHGYEKAVRGLLAVLKRSDGAHIGGDFLHKMYELDKATVEEAFGKDAVETYAQQLLPVHIILWMHLTPFVCWQFIGREG